MQLHVAKLPQQTANSAFFYSHLTANYVVLWRQHLGRYKGRYWDSAGLSHAYHFGSGVGSYKPSYQYHLDCSLEDGEGPRARVNCHFLVKKKYPPPATHAATPTSTKYSRTK